MTASFSLLTEPWLPVRFAGEPNARDVSIIDAIAQAHEIRELADASPLVTVALHRLLVAVLHCAYGPATHSEWVALWEAGRFDPAPLERYLADKTPAFDLFDPERPFYQLASLPADAAVSIAKLGHAYSAGNNPVLFDHTRDAEEPALSPAAAAQLLVAQHGFAVGGLISRLPGEPTSAEAGHLLKGAVILATGTNLYQTLVLNMVRVDGIDSAPFEFNPADDAPAWARPVPSATPRRPGGYLDLLTWQSRRIRLLRDEDGLVRRAVLMAGHTFPKDYDPRGQETMVAYHSREQAKGQRAWFPLGFRVERALWRDSTALFQAPESAADDGRPRTLRELAGRRQAGYIDREAAGLSAFGLSSSKAKLFLWRREDLPLPLAFVDQEDLVAALAKGLDAADGARSALRTATWVLASESLGPDGTADRARVDALLASLEPERAYWPQLDLPFRRFMVDLARSYAQDYGRAAEAELGQAIDAAARAAFEQAAAAVATSGRGQRAEAIATPRFLASLGTALGPLQPEEVTA
ncbi:MAG: type I-E CRISPR-associated protein Cse1/CasA [Dehalococcoidia bacterium]|nr:type I-E CRISPR-associated protein Cse1/CasA [Dehalococcoidia bacterium]